MSLYKEGEIVDLVAQVECPDETVFIRAFIYDRDDILLAMRNLADQGNGRFTNYDYPYPSGEPSLTVHYKAFTDSSYTVELDYPCPNTEVLKRLQIEEAQAVKIDHLLGLVSENKLMGIISNAPSYLIGIVSNVQLIGRVYNTNNLTGLIDNSSLIGELKGC